METGRLPDRPLRPAKQKEGPMADRKPDRDRILDKAYTVETNAEVEDLYREWAARYDADTVDRFGYVAPQVTAEAFARHCRETDRPVIDLGCGTGLSGAALAEHGFTVIDGVDLSRDMLQRAETKGIYRSLIRGDLADRLPIDDASYEGGISVGTFTHGHVGPDGLSEALRVLRPGAVFTFTVNEGVWDAQDWTGALEALETAGKADIREIGEAGYLREEGIGCVLVTLKIG
jgi:predicted TPR repeat methyltransferase